MARLIFPRIEKNSDNEIIINDNGNLLWGKDNSQPQDKVWEACSLLNNKGYFASPFPERDGITFRNDSLTNKEIYLDVTKAFNWLVINLIDTPENRRLLLELGVDLVPKPGNFYYKICNINSQIVNDKEVVTITGPDVLSGKMFSISISRSEFDLIENGVHFQTALRSKPANEREFLISGVSTNDLFKEFKDNDNLPEE